jgi:hypothetical protein
MPSPDDDPLTEHFAAALAVHRLAVPDALRAGTLAGYRELRGLADLLHAPRPAADEAAAVFLVPGNPSERRA